MSRYPYPISDQYVQNLYPISDQNGSKTIPIKAAHTYIPDIGEYPPGGVSFIHDMYSSMGWLQFNRSSMLTLVLIHTDIPLSFVNSLFISSLLQSPHSHAPYGDDGSGFYSDNTIGCYNVILESAPLMLESIKSALVKPGSVFTIVDYGCADGGTSMPLLYACVTELRKIYGDDLPIHVIYEDQPINDFKSLFLRLQG